MGIMSKLKWFLLSVFSKGSAEKAEGLKALDEYEIYCSGKFASHSTEESVEMPAEKRGRYQFTVKVSDKEITQQVFIRQPPSLITHPIYTIPGLTGTWRLALDKHGESIYATNNSGCGTYSVFSLLEGKGQLVRTVQCSDIWNIRGIAVDASDNVYLSGDHKIQKYDHEGQLVSSFGSSEPGSAWYQCNDPNGLCCYEDRLYVCDSCNQRVQVLSLDFEHLGVVGDASCLKHPEDLEFDSEGHMHVLDSGSTSVVVFDSEGSHLHDVNLPEADLRFPVSVRMVAGNYYISDLAKSHIAVLSSAGELLHRVKVQSREEVMEEVDGFVYVTGSSLQRPVGLAVDSDGYIYVSNVDSKEIVVF